LEMKVGGILSRNGEENNLQLAASANDYALNLVGR